MKQGEVWQVRIPASLPGHEQAGERPGIIILKDGFIPLLPTVLMVPCTSNLATARFAGTLILQPDGQNGLTLPSVALVFQMRALDKRRFLRPLGFLSQQLLDQILALFGQLTT